MESSHPHRGAPGQQLTLGGLESEPAQSHANRGMDFEAMLERTHALYARQRIGSVLKLPNYFVFCGWDEWERLAPSMRATTGDKPPRPLKRIKSPFDFTGCVRGRSVSFDAKEFSGTSIPIANLKEHQTLNLWRLELAGAVAGFMLRSKRTNQIFWLPASQALALHDALRFRKPIPKSLNLAWLCEHARLLGAGGRTVDWAAALAPEERKNEHRGDRTEPRRHDPL